MIFFSPFFSYKIKPTTRKSGKIHLVLSAKKIKLAVDRNRLKRLFREAIRQTKFKTKENQRFFCYIKPEAKEARFSQIKKDVFNLNEKNNSKIN